MPVKTGRPKAKTHTGHRHDPPVKFVGAAHFDRDAHELGPAELVRLMRDCPLFTDFLAEVDYSVEHSVRDREPGSWGLAFLAFAASIIPDMKPWWRDSDRQMWWEAGFKRRPEYDLMYRRFVELEKAGGIKAFFELSAKLVRLAVAATDGLIGRDLYVDAREAESNARMFHDCQEGEECPTLKNRKRNHLKPKGPRVAGRMTVQDAKSIRQSAAELLPEPGTEHDPIIGDGLRLYYDAKRKVMRTFVGDHWWVITDPTAGCRTHEGDRKGVKSWIGFSQMDATDGAVGLAVACEVDSCSVPEWNIYPNLYEKVKDVLDGAPRSVCADKGLATKDVIQMHSNDGVFSVMPFRGNRSEPERSDHERWDRYGIPRCENCGGTTRFVSFTTKPSARVMFECLNHPFEECKGRQQLACSEDPRFVLPLWRDTPLFRAIKERGFEHERAHRMTRQRHGSSGNNFGTRPKRKGASWQQLLANASIVVDWFKLNYRNGWLPGTTCKVREDAVPIDGLEGTLGFSENYANKGLHRPYGQRAVALDPTGKTPWRMPQKVSIKSGGAQAPLRPRTSKRARALTELLPDAEAHVEAAVEKFMADQEEREKLARQRARRKAKAEAKNNPEADDNVEADVEDEPDPESSAGVSERNQARAQKARGRAGPDRAS